MATTWAICLHSTASGLRLTANFRCLFSPTVPLSRIDPKPKLSVLAHFPVADDTVECALQSVKNHFPRSDYPVLGKDIVWATDLMVLRVKKSGITQLMGQVSDYTFDPPIESAEIRYADHATG